MIFFVLVLLLIMFRSMKIAAPGQFNREYLSKKETAQVKGIFVILVLLGHAVTYIQTKGIVDNLYIQLKNHLHQMVVVMFFFYSGYGMMKSILTKKFDYVKGLPAKRFLPVFVNFVIAVLLFVLVNFMLGQVFPFQTVLLSMIGWSSVGNSNWYMFVVFMVYILMFVSFYALRWFKKSAAIYLCTLFFTILVVAFVYWEIWMGLSSWWYNTVFLVPVGCWFALLQKPVESILMRNDYLYALICALLLSVYAVSYEYRLSGGIGVYTIWAVTFTITVVCFTMKVSFHSQIFAWFGKHVFSVYILQRIPMIVLSRFGMADRDKYMFMVLCIIFTILLAMIFDYFILGPDKKIKTKSDTVSVSSNELSKKNFADLADSAQAVPSIREQLEEKPFDLNSPEIIRDLNEVKTKLIALPQSTILQLLHKMVLVLLKKYPVKNQVLFISIRKDGELEGNAKALYPHIKGKKLVRAKMLPHNLSTELSLFFHVYSSKVIVTDDYLKYLRNFPLREDQRVIQLWHACGAFKKFGQRGTNLSVQTDIATHAQYNLVTVSSDSIRAVYADAFCIDIQKVKSLGCPRTDYFFDPVWIEGKREAIYKRHPEWRDKKIILYAPTFRDMKGKRSEFYPELDFGELSERLLPDQIFVICPHPVMKNSILNQKYDNICVVREFSTNDMMHVSHMMITDYSSVIFEYVLLNKPIAFFCYDLAEYDRGFYLKYPDDLPGEVFRTQEELTGFICEEARHVITKKHIRFVEKYMSACDGHSCERIAGLINSYMGECNA